MRFTARVPYLGDEIKVYVPLLPNALLVTIYLVYQMAPNGSPVEVAAGKTIALWIVYVVRKLMGPLIGTG